MAAPINFGNLDECVQQFNPIVAKYKLYNGEVELLYRDDELFRHTYGIEVDCEFVRCPGVTSITECLHKPALVPWAVKVCAEWLLAVVEKDWAEGDPADRKLKAMPWEQFVGLVSQSKGQHKRIKEEAADIGHIAHEWIEKYLKRQNPAMPDNPEAVNCINAALRWMDAHNFRTVSVENKVYSRNYNFAGTYDANAYVDSCGDPDCCGYWNGKERVALTFKDWYALVDWKSSSGIWDEYRLQTAAYVHGKQEEFPDKPFDARFIVRLGKYDGDLEPLLILPEDQENDFGGFLGLLTVYERLEAIKARDKQERSSERAEKKAAREAKKAAEATAKEARKAERAAKKAAKEKVN